MIQRYSYDEGDGNWRFPGHVKDNKGEFVTYKDHKAEVEAAYNKGYARGRGAGEEASQPSWRL